MAACVESCNLRGTCVTNVCYAKRGTNNTREAHLCTHEVASVPVWFNPKGKGG